MKKGFTLLEIIIVIIIIGVLASLALPRLFAMVENARTAEALAMFTSIRSSMERCYFQQNGDYRPCQILNDADWSKIDMENPTDSPNSHFTYRVPVNAFNSYEIYAVRNSVENTNMVDGWLEFHVRPNEVYWCGGGNLYEGMGDFDRNGCGI